MERIARGRIEWNELDCIAHRWADGDAYLGYVHKPRRQSGLFFVTSELTATYSFADGRELVVNKNDILFIPSGIYYSVRFNTPDKTRRVNAYIINFDFFDDVGKPFLFDDHMVHLKTKCSAECIQLLEELTRTCHDALSRPYRRLSLFYSLLDFVTSPQDIDYSIRQGVGLLQAEWNQSHQMSRYARACGLSESHFRARFRKWAGMSPVEYRMQLRISHARSYLSNSSMSVAQIAALTGFEDVFYFSRAFKKITGLSPRKYREMSPM